MATLWDKGFRFEEKAERFTIGKDRELDLRLAKYDIIGSKAHLAMLEKIGLLPSDDYLKLSDALDAILSDVENGKFHLEEGVEDIHSQVELLLTEKLGDIGKKIHSGRSRNDQVAVDLKLFFKDECQKIRDEVMHLFKLLIRAFHLRCQMLRFNSIHLPINILKPFLKVESWFWIFRMLI